MDPASMPLFDHGQLRKRWRYVAVFAEELMLCAARVEIGPATQSFWVLWDRERRQQWAHTNPLPGNREVSFDGPRLEIDGPDLGANLELGEVAAIEATCPSGKSLTWTRKRAGVPVTGTVDIPGRRWQVTGRGIDDESAGHHQRHTHWHWSAGVGESLEGRNLAWNLVEGINDSPQGSERAIWVDGEPGEPPPVRFRGLDGIELGEGESLDFASESDHARDDNYLLIRSRYRHRFGSFAGSLGGLTLASGLGVMEEHDATW
jgi:Domain of unknown function (DUF2804), C-terminal